MKVWITFGTIWLQSIRTNVGKHAKLYIFLIFQDKPIVHAINFMRVDWKLTQWYPKGGELFQRTTKPLEMVVMVGNDADVQIAGLKMA